MRFEVSERITTRAERGQILQALEGQFRKTAAKVTRAGQGLSAESIEASFGSINRQDTTDIRVDGADGGYLLVAEVNYRPSFWFWIFLIAGLFTTIAWLIPIGFYLYQKNVVQKSIETTFQRIRNEFTQASGGASSSASTADELTKLAELKERGVLTEEEFNIRKKQLLGL